MKSLTKKYGSWAVVTGASSGIGRSFAHQLARAGMNVVLVARSEDALNRTADELRSQYAVQTRVLALDLSSAVTREILDQETLDLDVGLLVNNAAIEQRGTFVRHSPEELSDVIRVNVTAPTDLAQRFGRRFVDRQRGGIIFVSGSIGYQGVPYLANYAATKAHQVHLAEALYYELRPYGVDVLGLSPGLTKTPMVGRMEESIRFGRIGMLQLCPDRVAKVGLRHLGRRPSVVAGWEYKFFALMTKRLLTRAQGAWLFGTLIRMAFADASLLDPRQDRVERSRQETTSPSKKSSLSSQRRCAVAGCE